jgi:UDP-N-acetylmuramoyl-L-alanyl-D-glutamate--2,6-diaminopimelate ligase
MTGNPSQHELDALANGLTTLAVTGTNGKTSTTSMIASIVRAAGEPAVRVTTLGMWVGDEQIADDSSMASFIRAVRRAHEVGARTLALEVTSRALEAGFAARWPAQIAVFTNLTHDHLDRHGTPERYLAAKAQLFVRLRPTGVAVLNAADPASSLLADVVPPDARCVGFLAQPGVAAAANLPVELSVARLSCDQHGIRIGLADSPLATELGGGLQLRVLGAFQVDNALAAALAAAAAGYNADAIRRGLAEFGGVPGRFEVCSHQPLVFVDFAHSPDALARVLESARALVGHGGRLGCVFGCGGERDSEKRPRMGELADRLADVVWLTTDNPRGDDPAEIAAMVRAGVTGRASWHDLPERRAAIAAAVDWAGPDDVVVIAGRGPETHQQLACGPIPLLDKDAVREALQRRRC